MLVKSANLSDVSRMNDCFQDQRKVNPSSFLYAALLNMRFPRLSHLFHRRTKSDSDLAPVSITVPVTAYATTHASTVPTGDSSYPLTQRIRYLESALQGQYEANRCIPVLEAALQTERAALHTAREANSILMEDITALQADILEVRKELFSALDNRLSTNDDRLMALSAENACLIVERLRNRRFIELMISAGGRTLPVLDHTWQLVSNGAEPEEALVIAIKEAVSRPGSSWRVLLEPVTGQRSPEEYIAQVNSTLQARRETHDWRKRAKFWKGAALESGRHSMTVTPSPSNISSIIEELSSERQQAVDDLLERLRSGTHPLKVKRKNTRAHEIENGAMVEAPPAALSIQITPSMATISEVEEEAEHHLNIITLSSTPVAPLAATSSSMILPISFSHSHTCVNSSYANLPPLASETFRASQSIKSIASRRSSKQPREVGEGDAKLRRQSIPRSQSASTHDSRASVKSKHRRTQIVAVPLVQVHAQSTTSIVGPSKSNSAQSLFGASVSAATNISAAFAFGSTGRLCTSATLVPSSGSESTSISASGTASGLSSSSSGEPTPRSSVVPGLPPMRSYLGQTLREPYLSPAPLSASSSITAHSLLATTRPKTKNESDANEKVLILHSDFIGSSSSRATPEPVISNDNGARVPVRKRRSPVSQSACRC
ncbi:hypothetical protein A0H81_13614 [Grifola frondosa]|uniref:Uncharacterized protein n=1 Tax=Grifola frondosa TaxID=5627 RepID=A0A1C7LNP0_GRIFR|nr:hypothetical protein A0H81_13614 [Grifola frondosa]